MILSHKNNFIFFKPMKVAGSSIESQLSKHCADTDLLTGDREHENLKPQNSEQFHSHTPPNLFVKRGLISEYDMGKYFKFTVVRNPWDLVVSYYWHSVATTNRKIDVSNFENIRSDFNEWLNENYIFNWPQWDHPPLSGKELLDFIANKAKAEGNYSRIETLKLIRQGRMKVFAKSGSVVNCYGSDPNKFWLKTPLDYISTINEHFYDGRYLNFTIRYENLEEDFRTVCKEYLSLPHEELPKLKSQYRTLDAPYEEYYTFGNRDRVAKAFEWSIERYQYKF